MLHAVRMWCKRSIETRSDANWGIFGADRFPGLNGFKVEHSLAIKPRVFLFRAAHVCDGLILHMFAS